MQMAGRLPAERDSFVGRRREVAEVRRQLAAGRAVTIVGAGGVGKTRLALRVARDLRRAYPDGVWLVELGNLREPALLGHNVANAVGVVAPPAGDVRAALVEYLASRQALLLLDNCEHLRAASVELMQQLLSGCPELTVLATSREVLGLPEEVAVAVAPLDLPDLSERLTLATTENCESVALFVARASAAASDFRLTNDNAPAVARICHDLDGIPLAIELAAVRLRGLSVEQMADRLADRFRLLTAARRDGPERHQTLQSCLQWSYELCTIPERLLWSRAAIFVGGFELAAARAICGGDGLEPDAVADLLDTLVDKSILIADGCDDVPRYRMLETLREFGTSKLTADQNDTLHELFVDWHQQLTGRAYDEWLSTEQVGWFARLDREHANIQLALDWCLEQGTEARVETALTMLSNLYHYYWWGRAWQQEGRLWLRRALALPSPKDSAARARALNVDAALAHAEGDFAGAEPELLEAERIATAVGSPEIEAFTWWNRLTGHMYRAEASDAYECAARVLSLLEGHEPSGLQMDTYMCKASTAAAAGEPELAAAACDEMERVCAAAGDVFHRGYATWLRGLIALGLGDAAAATELERESMRLRTMIGDATGMGWTLEIMAWAEGALGHAGRAATLLGAADRLWESSGRPLEVYQHFVPFHAGCESGARSALGHDDYLRAFVRGHDMSMDAAIAYALGEEAAGTEPLLTCREREIAELVAAGLTNRQIGQRLCISERTVDGHVQRLLKKLDVPSRLEVCSRLAALETAEAEPAGAPT